jgi:cell wall assembly regulator SMI1
MVPRKSGVPLPPGASDGQINDFARRTGLSVPSEVREWLRFTDGPRIGPGGVYGLRDFEEVYGFLPQFRENRWLPLGTDGCGNYYVPALGSEDRPLQPVYFVDPLPGGYGTPAYAVA